MATRVHIIWTLVMVVFWALAFGIFNKHFDGADLERRKVAALEKKLRSNQRQVAKLETRFSEFKDSLILAGVKIDKHLKWFDEKRSIASVISDPSKKQNPLGAPGNISLSHAKKVFAHGQYRRSAELFEDFMQNYPDHPSSPLATFLLGESYFQIGSLQDSLRALNVLITHFPETETACLGMIRLGKIFEQQERLEDALEIYQLARPLYPKSKCEELAKASIKGLNL